MIHDMIRIQFGSDGYVFGFFGFVSRSLLGYLAFLKAPGVSSVYRAWEMQPWRQGKGEKKRCFQRKRALVLKVFCGVGWWV